MCNFPRLLQRIIDIVYHAAMYMCQCTHYTTGTVTMKSVLSRIEYIEMLTDIKKDEENFNVNELFGRYRRQDDTL